MAYSVDCGRDFTFEAFVKFFIDREFKIVFEASHCDLIPDKAKENFRFKTFSISN